MFLSKFRNGEPFAFSRWGDGEWKSVLQAKSQHSRNCDGHYYFPEMGRDLAQVLLKKPQYVLGMQGLALRMFPRIATWLQEHGLNDLAWYDADVFHKTSIAGRLAAVLSALGDRYVILVGPNYLRKLSERYLKYRDFVEVPRQNAYLQRESIVRAVRAAVTACGDERAVVAVSAGMPAELIIDDLAEKCLAAGHTLVDFGSLWDPLVGVHSRTYHKHLGKK